MKPTHLKSIPTKSIIMFFTFFLMAGWAFVPLTAVESTAVTSGETEDVIIRAMKDELDRSMKSLRIDKAEKPYYLEYTVQDSFEWGGNAVFGALTMTSDKMLHWRSLKVGLRVGSYTFDNSGFVGRGGMFRSRSHHSYNMAIDDDYDVLRRDIWLTTDAAYKSALERLAGKNAYIKNQTRSDELPDFSREKSVRSVLPRKRLTLDVAKWEGTIKRLSAIFRDFPVIHESGVEMVVRDTYKYYINSEGALICRPQPMVELVAFATARAVDGMTLKHHIPFYGTRLNGFPSEKKLAAGIRQMAEELTALAKAPVLDEYIGPVMFTGQASAELFIQVLAPHFSGHRAPLGSNNSGGRGVFSSKLARRINRRVTHRGISISDEPTRRTYKKESLLGFYPFDDQGIPAVPVKLVEKGILKGLLMSRRPTKENPRSNGHARASFFKEPTVYPSNLFVTAEKGKTFQQLKQQLLELCKEQQLPFGLIVKSVDNPGISGMDYSSLGFGADVPPLTSPVMVVRVYAEDGREELVRGLTINELNVRYFREIVGVGNDYRLFHRILPDAAEMYPSGSRYGGVPGSVVSPSVLFEELEFKKDTDSRKNPPLLKHPYFEKAQK